MPYMLSMVTPTPALVNFENPAKIPKNSGDTIFVFRRTDSNMGIGSLTSATNCDNLKFKDSCPHGGMRKCFQINSESNGKFK